MNPVYVFSGLGVDHRVFDRIVFDKKNTFFVQWIEPYKNETIEAYAARISEPFKDKNPILIGLSFGGMLCVEISKIIPTKKVILISSAKTKVELPLIYRLAGKLKLHKMVPNFVIKRVNFVTAWMFGLQSKEEWILLGRILKDTDSQFLSWALQKIVEWKNIRYPENYIHIHGSKDKIMPLHLIKTDYTIENGGHFMIFNQSEKIQKILNKNI